MSAKPMTRAGVGPRWVLLSALFSAPFIAARLLWPEHVAIGFVPRLVVVVTGLALIGMGVPLCAAAIYRLAVGFPRGELFTGGAYAICRHPIYGSWIVFIVPGIVLLANNWAGLFAPLLMYAALRWLVREEEVWLEQTFGDAYRAYRARVPFVFPLARLLWRGSRVHGP